jgi:hypothetical protein
VSLKEKLESFLLVLLEEASRNPEFEARLIRSLEGNAKRQPDATGMSASQDIAEAFDENEELRASSRPKNRRAKAVLEPVSLIRDGESVLRGELEKLNLEQLRDIVAEYGMDSGRLVMKWVKPARVIDRIVEIAAARATKGHAFRRQDD